MNFKNGMNLLMILTVLVGLSACGSMKKKNANNNGNAEIANSAETEAAAAADASDLSLNSDSDSGKAGPLKTIRFAFNSARLSSSAKSALQTNAAFLKANSSLKVQVEGHCDERGGVQFNLALGEQRAKNVRSYLVSLGVSSRQLSTISFGKERPLAFGHDESSWNLNRRANFVITAK